MHMIPEHFPEWDRVQAQLAAARAALEAVEWIPVATTSVCICPWCGYPSYNGHAPDCPRQRSLGVKP